MLKRKKPKELGWMCGVREREGSGKSLVSSLDNLVNNDVIHDDRKHKRETKPRGGEVLGDHEKLR